MKSKFDPDLSAAAAAVRAGFPIPPLAAARLEARGYDLCALSERIQNN